jgi:hypothetical protein
MLFEPCGDLLKDYGAYCETLRVTEREEVYSAIHTRSVAVPRTVAAVEDNDIDDNRSGVGSATSPKSKSPRRASRTGTSGRRKSSLKSSADAASSSSPGDPGMSAADAVAAPPLLNVTLTSITLHYPVFSLNQRDMTPLCRAVPHCPSLVSIELVGCGLSVQSYMKLVEAVYRSPRMISLAVDFNVPLTEHTRHRYATAHRDTVDAGFVADPTLYLASYSSAAGTQDFLTEPLLASDNATGGFRASVSSAVFQEPHFNASATTAPPPDSVTGYPALATGENGTCCTANAAAQQQGDRQPEEEDQTQTYRSGSAARSASDAASTEVTLTATRLSQGSNAGRSAHSTARPTSSGSAGGTVSAGITEDDNVGAVLYLYPTQYCGLDQQPTPLELQLQEEKEKKGKVDAKKVQQLQAQRDNLRAFDQQHRIPVPKAWDGVLFTGIHHLSLRGNHIDDAAASRLAQVLMEHPQSRLVSLNLWGNDITDTGATALARMLRVNNVLQALDLGNNRLSDAGLLELVRVFLMKQVTSQEEILAARRAYLTRRGASEEEQKAANQPPVLTDIPSYEDLYAHWWHMQQQQHQAATPAEPSLRPADASAVNGGGATPRPHALVPSSLPAPPPRDSQSSPTAAGNPKRTPPVKSKAPKSESVTAAAAAVSSATMMSTSAARAANRPTVGFDKDCVRVRHIADNDAAIRIPGNTVLEVLNLEENSLITVAGAQEAARLLRLREPADAAEMLAMVEVREVPGLSSILSSPPMSLSGTPDGVTKRLQGSPSRFGTSAAAASPPTALPNVSISGLPAAGVTVIRAPELHCAGLRLRVCSVRNHRESNRAAWAAIDAAQEEVNAALAMWTSPATAA